MEWSEVSSGSSGSVLPKTSTGSSYYIALTKNINRLKLNVSLDQPPSPEAVQHLF
jgi:hypothetical protein